MGGGGADDVHANATCRCSDATLLDVGAFECNFLLGSTATGS